MNTRPVRGKTQCFGLIGRNTAVNGECLEWIGARNADGYGVLRCDRKVMRVHRLVYEHHFGFIPSGLFICHTCDNRPCINPRHLFLGNAKTNAMDMAAKHRVCSKPQRGSKMWNSKLTEDDVVAIRSARNSGSTYTHIAKMFSVTPQAIYYICNRGWKHV